MSSRLVDLARYARSKGLSWHIESDWPDGRGGVLVHCGLYDKDGIYGQAGRCVGSGKAYDPNVAVMRAEVGAKIALRKMEEEVEAIVRGEQ
jgi:hypothetical protein